ncbi:MAG: 50S ribosomal protein L10 [Candidatus Omnitrophota bacterium]
MKKLGLIFKESSENLIKDSLKTSESFFVIGYSKVDSPGLTALRISLKKANASLFVVKNTVLVRALKESGLETLVKNVEGPCALVFTKDEPVNASKILYDFNKTNENLKISFGYFNEMVLEKKDIEALAKLPSLEVLRGALVITLNSPISRLAMALNSNLRKLVYCLDQIKGKLGKEGG